MTLLMKNLKRLMAVVVLLGLAHAPAYASSTPLDDRIWEAKEVIEEIQSSPDQSIPEELLAKCEAIAIYPNVIKGGFVIGARYGKGVVLRKGNDGKWGPLAFSTIGGGSWGLQIGAQATDLILVIMSERGLNGLLSSNFTLGVDGAATAGPVGRNASAGTDLSLRAEMYSYSRSRGLFGGIALDGAVLTQDNNSNSLYYNKNVTSKDILLQNEVKPQRTSKELIEVLNKYSAQWKKK